MRTVLLFPAALASARLAAETAAPGSLSEQLDAYRHHRAWRGELLASF